MDEPQDLISAAARLQCQASLNYSEGDLELAGLVLMSEFTTLTFSNPRLTRSRAKEMLELWSAHLQSMHEDT